MLTRIVPDDAMAALLARAGRNLDTVPARGETVQLRDTANLSTGGTAVDRTDDIPPLNRPIAEPAAAKVGMDVCEIGRAPGRERGGAYGEITVGADPIKK